MSDQQEVTQVDPTDGVPEDITVENALPISSLEDDPTNPYVKLPAFGEEEMTKEIPQEAFADTAQIVIAERRARELDWAQRIAMSDRPTVNMRKPKVTP